MSNHTKAWAIAREVPDSELRTALIDAHERMLDAAEELEPGSDDLEGAVYSATEWRDQLDEIATKLECDSPDEIEGAIEELQERPEKPDEDGKVTPAETPEVRELKARMASLEKQLDEAIDSAHALRVELDAEKVRKAELPVALQEAVGDVLAMSRKLTQVCETAGIKPAHIRVTRTRRKAS